MTGGGGHHLHGGGYKHDGQQQRQRLLREVESSNSSSSCLSDELVLGEENNFLGICTQELLARGTELLKRTRKGKPTKPLPAALRARGGFHWRTDLSRIAQMFLMRRRMLVVVSVQGRCIGRSSLCTSTARGW